MRFVLGLVLAILPLFFLTRANTAHVSALPSDNLNFQARLESSTGAIAPDGYYDIEFKLYNADTGGTSLWTETRSYNSGSGQCSGPLGANDCRVRVANGYVSVYLGSVTSFPSTIPWDQQLYLTMNVGGTTASGPITWDGEMNPRLKLTAVPYAMAAKNAEQITKSSGANIATLSIAAPTSGNQTFVLQDQGAAGTYNILTDYNAPTVLAGSFIQNQNAAVQSTSNYWISGTGRADTSILTPLLDTAIATALNLGTTNATSINLNQNTTLAAGKSITLTGGNTASRPASPTEGMVYYDTTTKQLLTYSNGKWQADRSEAIVVAASNSSDADKASADYVATGTSDQTVINTALTNADPAGTGRKTGRVVLLAGTFTTTDAISIPNDTTLAGIGRGTLIKFANIDGQNKNMVTNTDPVNGEGVTVRDLRLDGNRTVNTSGTQHGVYFNGVGAVNNSRQGATVNGVWAMNFRGDGIYLFSSYLSTILGSTSQDNAGNGFRIHSSHRSNVSNNLSIANDAWGVVVIGSKNIVVNGNTIAFNGELAGATTSGGMIIHGSSSENAITNNAFRDSGIGTGASNPSIYVNTASNNTITGNNIADTNGTTGYAINIANASSTNNYLSNNVITGTYVAPLIDNGTDTIWAGQQNGTSATADYLIQPAGSIQLLKDTYVSGKLQVGSATTDATINLFGLDSYNNATDPTGFNGAMYYNTSTNKFRCFENGAWTNCAASAENVIQNQSAAAQTTATFWIQGSGRSDASFLAPQFDAATGIALSLGATNATSITIGKGTVGTVLASSTITAGTSGSATTLQGAAQLTANTAGNDFTIKGSAGNGTGNGGTLLISGGDAGATGTMGLVSLNPTSFAAQTAQTLGSSQTLNQAWINNYSTLPLIASNTGLTFTVPAPAISTVGRVYYISNAGTNDFNILLNGTSINIALKANSTATLIWNGNGWTAAGASSATDLQAAYNNTLSSAGAAELVLNAPGGAADGLTIRNNGTPITGALFEVQSSIATNLFSVNNNTIEYAVNGGAENTTLTAWSNYNAGVATKTTAAGTFATGLAGVSVTTSGTNQGAKNTLASTLPAGNYVVSFAAKLSSGGPSTFNIWYSANGTAQTAACNTSLPGTGYTISPNFTVSTSWTKVSCFIIVPSGGTATNAILIANQSNISFYLDNLSVISNAATTTPANVQIGGGATGGQPTLFTLDQFAGPPMSTTNAAYFGSMYYDTSIGAIQCYQSSGWGACGSAPDDIISMTPEYTGAVLNGTGVGTMTADFCANSAALTVGTLCSSNEARNFYKWTSPQATAQSYSIYVTYRLPSTFKSFKNGTMSLNGLTDSTTNAGVKYALFRKSQGGGVAQCSADTAALGSANTWTQIAPTTDITSSTCGVGQPNAFVAGDTLIIRITVNAQSNASAYVENLTFQYSNK